MAKYIYTVKFIVSPELSLLEIEEVQEFLEDKGYQVKDFRQVEIKPEVINTKSCSHD